jgi:hypothetical protein
MTIQYNTYMVVCGHLVYFFRFGMFGPRKIWQTWVQENDLSHLIQ